MRRFYLCPICGLFERNYDVPVHRHWLGQHWTSVPVEELTPMQYFERLQGCEVCPTCGSNCSTYPAPVDEEPIPEPQDDETYGRFL